MPRKIMPTGNARDKIRAALDLYAQHGEALCSDAEIGTLIESCRSSIARSHQFMRDAGVVEACGLCAAEVHGSCCAQGVEEWYDEVLLLMNLLLGCEIDGDRLTADACLFVGPHGCRLQARHAFCVNYFCDALKEQLGQPMLRNLMSAGGEELFRAWELEYTIRAWLKKK